MSQRVLDRQAHVRQAELRFDRAVHEFDQRMDDALVVDDDVDLVEASPNSQWASITSRPLFRSVAESMVILGPMLQVGCFSASAGVTRATRHSTIAKSAARGRQQQATDALGVRLLALQTLPDSAVLTIDREQRRATL